jgi:hypothetical protein
MGLELGKGKPGALEIAEEIAQMRHIANALQDCVTRRAAPDAAARPELDLRDRAVREAELVLPGAGWRKAERPYSW